jgi:ribonuclease P protein component
VAELRPSGRYSAPDRVRKRSQYLRIQGTGGRVVSPGFVFMLERSSSEQGPRLGITASRRVGNAVERNRAKRLVREAFRAVRGTWPARADVVVIVRQALGNRKLADVVAEWQAAQGRIIRRFTQLAQLDGQEASQLPPTEPLVSKPQKSDPSRGGKHRDKRPDRKTAGAGEPRGG